MGASDGGSCLELGDALVPDPGGEPSEFGKLVSVPMPIFAEMGLLGIEAPLSCTLSLMIASPDLTVDESWLVC